MSYFFYMENPDAATKESNKIPENIDDKPKEDFRTKQIRELEKLQVVLDENTILRSKYNALLAQVAPLTDDINSPPPMQTGGIQFQSDRVYTPEEIEQLRQKLAQTLTEYRDETRVASLLNSEIEKKYNELSSLKMKFRLDQDEKLTKQNQASSLGMSSFKAKSQRVNETWNIERQRLNKAINFLQTIFDTSTADSKEFDEQMKANNRGIQHLSSSITIAKEDIRDFSDQIQKIEPKLQEYLRLKEKHQKAEELVVKLNDELDRLKKQVATESLTANVRRQIDSGNQTIADLNRSIDQIINKTAATQDEIKDIRTRITSLEKKLVRTRHETEELKRTKSALKKSKEEIKNKLEKCRIEQENAAGENVLISQELRDGIVLEQNTAPWKIRKQVLELKGELKKLDDIEEKQVEYEKKITKKEHYSAVTPLRKRVAMIPAETHFP